MKKPWDKGWIPPPKPIRKWEGPATPEGWKRVDREDCVEFHRTGDLHESFWVVHRIIGRPGKKWRLYLRSGYPIGSHAPAFTSNSLEALLVWYAIERENEPQATEPLEFGKGTWLSTPQIQNLPRVIGDEAAKKLLESYRAAYPHLVWDESSDLGTLIHMDFEALERRLCKP